MGSFVVRLVQALKARHALIKLHFTEGSTEELDELRQRGEVDIAVLFRHALSSAAEEEHIRLIDNHLVGRRGDPMLRKDRISVDEVLRLPLILPGWPNGTRQQLEGFARRAGLQLDVALEARTIAVQAELAAARCGYAIMPSTLIESRALDPRLAHVLVDDENFRRIITVSVSRARPLSAAVRAVLPMARELLGRP